MSRNRYKTINGKEYGATLLTLLIIDDYHYEKYHEPKIRLEINGQEQELKNDVVTIVRTYCSQEAKDHFDKLYSNGRGYVDGLISVIESAWEYIYDVDQLNEFVLSLTNDILCSIETEARYLSDGDYDYYYEYLNEEAL